MKAVKDNTADLIVPESIRRRAGIKAGDRLKFKASRGAIPITAVPIRTYQPTEEELAAIQRGEAQIARGEYVTLAELVHDLDRHRRKSGTKAARRLSR